MFGQTAPGVAALGIARGAAVEVFDTLDRVPPIDSSSDNGLKPTRVEGHVEFQQVGFSYVSRKTVGAWGTLTVEHAEREKDSSSGWEYSPCKMRVLFGTCNKSRAMVEQTARDEDMANRAGGQ